MYADDVDLDSVIEGAIDGYSTDRKRVWRADEEGQRALFIADRLAELLHAASEQLLSPVADTSDADWGFVREWATAPGLWPLAKERLQINLAWKVAPRTAEMADRCHDVTSVILEAAPGERVLKYVRRLTSCCIAGFFPECVVLARAVVERALKDTFERRRVPLPSISRGESPLGRLIDEAHRLAWLSNDAKAKAHVVRHRGNKAVHEDPELVDDVRDTVHAAITVIRELAAVR